MFVKFVRYHASTQNTLAKASCKATKKSTNRHCESPICFSFALVKSKQDRTICFSQTSETSSYHKETPFEKIKTPKEFSLTAFHFPERAFR